MLQITHDIYALFHAKSVKSIETFFSTKCTHLITTRPVPGTGSSYADGNMLPTDSASTPSVAQTFSTPLSSKSTPAPDRFSRYYQLQDGTPGLAASPLLTPAQSPARERGSMWER